MPGFDDIDFNDLPESLEHGLHPEIPEPLPTLGEQAKDMVRDEVQARIDAAKQDLKDRAKDELRKRAKDGLSKVQESVKRSKDVVDTTKKAADAVRTVKGVGDAAKVAQAAGSVGSVVGGTAAGAGAAATGAAAGTAAAGAAATGAAGTAAAGAAAAGAAATGAAGTAVAGTAVAGTAAGAGAAAAWPVALIVAAVGIVLVIVVTVVLAIVGNSMRYAEEQQQKAAITAVYINRNIGTDANGNAAFYVNMPITTTNLDGHAIPPELDDHGTPTGRLGIGKVSEELHLGITGHVFGPGGGKEGVGGKSGAFPDIKPDEEIWYVAMRWTYMSNVTWGRTGPSGGNIAAIGGYDAAAHAWTKDQKVLVTNMKTGRTAICVAGDWGPGVSGRIGGLSEETMYYLANRAGEKGADGKVTKTSMGFDGATDYKFEWIKDPQNYQLGPISPTDVRQVVPGLKNASPIRQAIVAFALRQVGERYSQSKRTSKGYWDCSSLAWGAYRKQAPNGDGNGIADLWPTNYPPTAAGELQTLTNTNGVRIVDGIKAFSSSMLPGDLVFLGGASNNRYKGVYHAIIYIGNGKVVEAAGTAVGVIKSSVPYGSSVYYTVGDVEAFLKGP